VLCVALSSALAGAVGGFTGGLIVSRLNLRPPGAVRMMMMATVSFLVGAVVLLLLSCPPVNIALTATDHSR